MIQGMNNIKFALLAWLFCVSVHVTWADVSGRFSFKESMLIDYSSQLFCGNVNLNVRTSLSRTAYPSVINQSSNGKSYTIKLSHSPMKLVGVQDEGIGVTSLGNLHASANKAENKQQTIYAYSSINALASDKLLHESNPLASMQTISSELNNILSEEGVVMQKVLPGELPATPIPVGDALPFLLFCVSTYALFYYRKNSKAL